MLQPITRFNKHLFKNDTKLGAIQYLNVEISHIQTGTSFTKKRHLYILSKRDHFSCLNGCSISSVDRIFIYSKSFDRNFFQRSNNQSALLCKHQNIKNLITFNQINSRIFSTTKSVGKNNDINDFVKKIKARYFENNSEEFNKFFQFSNLIGAYVLLVLVTILITTNKDRRKIYSYIFGTRGNLDQIEASIGSNTRIVVHENKGLTVVPNGASSNSFNLSTPNSFFNNNAINFLSPNDNSSESAFNQSYYNESNETNRKSVNSTSNINKPTPVEYTMNSRTSSITRFIPFIHTNYAEKLIDFLLRNKEVDYENVEIVYNKVRSDSQLYTYLFLPLLLLLFPLIMFRTMSGASNPINRIMNDQFGMKQMITKPDVKFSDVLGCEEAKMEIQEFVKYLKNRQQFEKLNARIPQGAILYGPPGTGKTLLAKALAGECGVHFFSCSGSEFIQMFVGRGASRVRDLFKTARILRPSIIFIDEIDAIASNRDLNQVSFSEKEGTLNQLLSEMDGFQNNKDIIVIGGTNKFSSLDRAILRPGRFDRHIFVGPPDVNGRLDLFKHYTKPLKMNVEIDKFAQEMAQMTPSFTGASIANICNEAAIFAARSNSNNVNKTHFLQAIDRVTVGNKTNRKLLPDEKKTVAIHEAGHAVVGWFLSTITPLVKTTIVPRGNALGFAQYLPSENHFYSKQQIFEQMVLLFGGRAAESIIIGEITSSASDDLSRITKLAYQYVGVWGMDEKIGNLSFISYSDHNRDFFGENKEFQTNLGDKVDEQVLKLVELAYQQARSIILQNKDKLIKVSELLRQHETVEQMQIESILGKKVLENIQTPFLSSTD